MRCRFVLAAAMLLSIIACSFGQAATPVAPERGTLSALPPTHPPPTPQVALALQLPPAGHLYIGVFPGGKSGEEDDITPTDLRSYEQAVGKKAAWVYFSHNWYRGSDFPSETATWIRDAGSVPYIRMMLRSDAAQNHADLNFTMDRIVAGELDEELRAWADAASEYGGPLIAEFGTEANGEWFSWNGRWNGAGQTDGYGDPSQPDGPEKFRHAYRHIVQVSRQAGASNITWVFHVNANDVPDEPWNRLEQYYPGDEWVDWIAVSVYGSQTPMEQEWWAFRDAMDKVYPRLAGLSASKPIVVSEFGVTAGNPLGDQADWAEGALADIVGGRWPRVIGFSWWNEAWQNDENPIHDTKMRVQDNPRLEAVFQRLVGADERVENGPLLAAAPPANWWTPAPSTTWQWQLSGLPVDQSVDADMYDIDLFDNDEHTVASLHATSRKVICYINAGAWEDWRPDSDKFPASIIGAEYGAWPGEKWLDVRQIDVLAPIMEARLDACRSKGFDGAEPDNIDGYANETGFPLTYEDQLKYNIWLAQAAHARGLSIGLKNDEAQAEDLETYFDWAMTEDCFYEQWCELMQPFRRAKKAVFAAEYTDTSIRQEQFCPRARDMGFSAILKNRDLDAFREAC